MMGARSVADQAIRLGEQCWPDISDRRPSLLLVPLGAVEQHGPGLPCATDALIAAHVTHQAARRLGQDGTRVLVAPVLPYGASGEHEDFPGTVSLGTGVLHQVVVELARSALRWSDGVVFVTGHGGNTEALVRAVKQLRSEGRAAAWTSAWASGADAHAGHTETSLLLLLAPDQVRVEKLEAGATAPLAELLPELRARGVRAVSENGVLGDPAGASAAEGRRILAEMVAGLVAELENTDVDPHGRLRVPAGVGAG